MSASPLQLEGQGGGFSFFLEILRLLHNLFVYLRQASKILSLVLKNNQVNLMLFTRLFVYLSIFYVALKK